MRLRPFKLERFFARYEFDAPYLLSSSDCEAFSIQEILDLEPGAAEALQKQWLGYTKSQGNPELRQAITTVYRHVEADNVLVHTGAEEAIFTFMNAILTPDDHIIVHYPCYQSLFEVANAIGCEVTRWETREEDGWELDIDRLRQNMQTNTKAIVINCPHNPTGYLMSKTKLEQIVEIAREYNSIIFSDEVYRLLEQHPDDTLPAACDLYENAVSLGVMSKTFGLPGLRIGWIATRNHRIYRAMEAFKDYLTTCNSAPSELLATIALRNKSVIIDRNMRIIAANLKRLDTFFDTYQQMFTWVRPKAGSVAFAHIRFNLDVEAFCTELLERQGVLLIPSTCYDFDRKHFRLGFGRRDMPECLSKLEEFIFVLR